MLILILFLILKRFQAFRFRLIMYVALCDMLSSFGILAGTNILNGPLGASADTPHTPAITFDVSCKIAAIAIQYFLLASSAWTSCIGFTLFRIVTKDSTYTAEPLEKWFHLVSWGLPAIDIIVISLKGLIGDGELWCWLKDSQYRFYLGYLPILFVIVFTVAFFGMAFRKKKRHETLLESTTYSFIADTENQA